MKLIKESDGNINWKIMKLIYLFKTLKIRAVWKIPFSKTIPAITCPIWTRSSKEFKETKISMEATVQTISKYLSSLHRKWTNLNLRVSIGNNTSNLRISIQNRKSKKTSFYTKFLRSSILPFKTNTNRNGRLSKWKNLDLHTGVLDWKKPMAKEASFFFKVLKLKRKIRIFCKI